MDNLYQAARDHIIDNGTGGLLLWSGNSPLGNAIKACGPRQSKLLPEPVNHASVVLVMSGVEQSRIFTYESLENGFQPHFLSHELEHYDGHVYWLPLKDRYSRKVIEDRMFQYDGTPYGYRELITFPIHRADISTETMICSESSEVVVTGNLTGKIHAPGELPDLGVWEEPVRIK
jgi:hypothetical protein